MAIAHVQTTNWSNGTSTSFTKTVPASATTGTLIILPIRCEVSSSATINTPAGYSAFATFGGGGTSLKIVYKIADGSDAGALATISGTSSQWGGLFSIFSGVDQTTPVVATQSTNSGTMSVATFPVNAVTMTQANSVLYAFYACLAGVTYNPSPMTEVFDGTGVSSSSYGAAYEAVTASGTTGTRTITTSASQNAWAAIGIGINPAAAPAATSLIWRTETPFRILSRR